jgi:hypothetical protein
MESDKSFHKLATDCTHEWIRDIYKIIDGKAPRYVADAEAKPISHSTDEINQIRRFMYDEVKRRRSKEGVKYQSLTECKDEMAKRSMQTMRCIMDVSPTKDGDKLVPSGNSKFVADGFWNPQFGTGTWDDPSMYSFATTPVSMFPQEATAYYSNGGIATVIIDKKAKGVLINGYSFEGEGWTPDEFERLHDYGEHCGYGEAVADGLRDGLVYGGSVAYPRFKSDNVETLEWDTDDLVAWGVIKQNCIDHWVTADRWNCVLVPNWNVTARDYLTPSHYYIPIGGVKVATKRSAIIRPRKLPYWGMLPQIGWGISDFEGYISSILAYMICIGAISIMFQQMSLLFHVMPLDGILAQNGVEAANQMLEYNTAAIDSASITHPRSINSFGEIKVVERHYEGVDKLIEALKVDIGARSEMPTSVIFPSQPTGLADSREEDVLLKQAESIKKIAVSVAPQLKQITRILALSCFGPEYFQGAGGEAKLDALSVTFEQPSIQTAEKQAEAGDKFATMIQTLVGAGFPLDAAVKQTLKFFPDVEVPEEIMTRLEEANGPQPEDMVNAPTLATLMEQGKFPAIFAGANGNGNGRG